MDGSSFRFYEPIFLFWAVTCIMSQQSNEHHGSPALLTRCAVNTLDSCWCKYFFLRPLFQAVRLNNTMVDGELHELFFFMLHASQQS